eukprot:TRINITY_DN60999_c0_g1_i1.p1 TRINITY_DN60999_c0_g1~~TRINITY_DN60999_c0_g1_i1.p1  ORF type:complete len:510 (-),score=54.33 TRINITY_DN60999_c0_g1_i1:32-1561(-)
MRCLCSSAMHVRCAWRNAPTVSLGSNPWRVSWQRPPTVCVFLNLGRGRHLSNTSDSGAKKIDSDKTMSLDFHAEAQRRLMQASATSMTVRYCRDLSKNRVIRFIRACTIDSNFDFRRWRKHKTPLRHLNLWTPRNIFQADNIRRLLFPDLALIGASSSLLCYYNLYVACPAEEIAWTINPGFNLALHPDMLTLPMQIFTVTSVAMGLLVTFTTQMSYGRFIEGRNLWGSMINESRALSSRILARVPSHSGNAKDAVLDARRHAVKLVRTFPVALKYHLTEDGCNPHIQIYSSSPEAAIHATTTLALKAELQLIWDFNTADELACAERILHGEANRPLSVLHELEHINATIFAHPDLGGLDYPAATEIDRSISKFHDVLGACEKILRTPIYTPYSKFTSRFLFIWCNTLPLAMYPVVGPVGTVPVSVIIAFFMLGIEDIGSRVEQPFDIMPLWQYCATIDQSCLQLERHAESLNQCKQFGVNNPKESDMFDEFDQYIADDRLTSYSDPLG